MGMLVVVPNTNKKLSFGEQASWLKMLSPGDKLACNPTEREKAEELTHLSSKIAKPVTIKVNFVYIKFLKFWNTSSTIWAQKPRDQCS
jgi:hypothetical protein